MNLREIIDRGAVLESVDIWTDEVAQDVRSAIRIALSFTGGGRLVLTADPDTDELIVTEGNPAEASGGHRVLRHPYLSGACGLVLFWAWEMKNQQGYFDALQLEFCSNDLSRNAILQFKVIASSISLFEVKPLAVEIAPTGRP